MEVLLLAALIGVYLAEPLQCSSAPRRSAPDLSLPTPTTLHPKVLANLYLFLRNLPLLTPEAEFRNSSRVHSATPELSSSIVDTTIPYVTESHISSSNKIIQPSVVDSTAEFTSLHFKNSSLLSDSIIKPSVAAIIPSLTFTNSSRVHFVAFATKFTSLNFAHSSQSSDSLIKPSVATTTASLHFTNPSVSSYSHVKPSAVTTSSSLDLTNSSSDVHVKPNVVITNAFLNFYNSLISSSDSTVKPSAIATTASLNFTNSLISSNDIIVKPSVVATTASLNFTNSLISSNDIIVKPSVVASLNFNNSLISSNDIIVKPSVVATTASLDFTNSSNDVIAKPSVVDTSLSLNFTNPSTDAILKPSYTSSSNEELLPISISNINIPIISSYASGGNEAIKPTYTSRVIAISAYYLPLDFSMPYIQEIETIQPGSKLASTVSIQSSFTLRSNETVEPTYLSSVDTASASYNTKIASDVLIKASNQSENNDTIKSMNTPSSITIKILIPSPNQTLSNFNKTNILKSNVVTKPSYASTSDEIIQPTTTLKSDIESKYVYKSKDNVKQTYTPSSDVNIEPTTYGILNNLTLESKQTSPSVESIRLASTLFNYEVTAPSDTLAVAGQKRNSKLSSLSTKNTYLNTSTISTPIPYEVFNTSSNESLIGFTNQEISLENLQSNSSTTISSTMKEIINNSMIKSAPEYSERSTISSTRTPSSISSPFSTPLSIHRLFQDKLLNTTASSTVINASRIIGNYEYSLNRTSKLKPSRAGQISSAYSDSASSTSFTESPPKEKMEPSAPKTDIFASSRVFSRFPGEGRSRHANRNRTQHISEFTDPNTGFNPYLDLEEAHAEGIRPDFNRAKVPSIWAIFNQTSSQWMKSRNRTLPARGDSHQGFARRIGPALYELNKIPPVQSTVPPSFSIPSLFEVFKNIKYRNKAESKTKESKTNSFEATTQQTTLKTNVDIHIEVVLNENKMVDVYDGGWEVDETENEAEETRNKLSATFNRNLMVSIFILGSFGIFFSLVFICCVVLRRKRVVRDTDSTSSRLPIHSAHPLDAPPSIFTKDH